MISDYRGDVDCNQSVRVYQTKAGSTPAWQSCLFLPQKLPQKEPRFREQESGKADLGKRQIVIKKCHLRDTSPKISSPDSLEQVKRFHSNILGRGRGVYIWSVYSSLTSAPQLLLMLSRSLCNMKCKAGQRYDNYI